MNTFFTSLCRALVVLFFAVLGGGLGGVVITLLALYVVNQWLSLAFVLAFGFVAIGGGMVFGGFLGLRIARTGSWRKP